MKIHKLYIGCTGKSRCCGTGVPCYAKLQTELFLARIGVITQMINDSHPLIKRHDIQHFPCFIFTKNGVAAKIIEGKFMDSTILDTLKELKWL